MATKPLRLSAFLAAATAANHGFFFPHSRRCLGNDLAALVIDELVLGEPALGLGGLACEDVAPGEACEIAFIAFMAFMAFIGLAAFMAFIAFMALAAFIAFMAFMAAIFEGEELLRRRAKKCEYEDSSQMT